MRKRSKSGDFSEIDRFSYNRINLSAIIPSIFCYVPPSAEYLGPATHTPVFKSGSTITPVFKPD